MRDTVRRREKTAALVVGRDEARAKESDDEGNEAEKQKGLDTFSHLKIPLFLSLDFPRVWIALRDVACQEIYDLPLQTHIETFFEAVVTVLMIVLVFRPRKGNGKVVVNLAAKSLACSPNVVWIAGWRIPRDD